MFAPEMKKTFREINFSILNGEGASPEHRNDYNTDPRSQPVATNHRDWNPVATWVVSITILKFILQSGWQAL